MRKQRLSPEQAFATMVLFLERYYARGGCGDDLAGLLGDIHINQKDGLPIDPAAWTDWLSAIEEVVEQQQAPAAEE
jgi:hypothetical protein